MPIFSSFGGFAATGRGARPGSGVVATGGTITDDGAYRVHTFTSSGTFAVQRANPADQFEFLIVGGGGGGIWDYGTNYTGGGGAGGYLAGTLTGLSVGNHTVTVGAGGSGGNGSNSTFDSYTGNGGGHASGLYQGAGAVGGSGGGGCCIDSSTPSSGGEATQTSQSPLTGYGYAGGAGRAIDGGGAGGGGGGAGGVGGDAASGRHSPGRPGAGRANSISGSRVTYATGGGNGRPTNGAANTGDGSTYAGVGGSGVVIVRYLK